MMERRVVVVGSGAAGTAAALAASKAGARVTLIRGRAGATSLTSGALDGVTGDDARAAIDALGIYALGACTVATSAGTLRPAAGRDRGLCDLSACRASVLVARVAHPSWDADTLAASYAELDKQRSYVVRDVGLVVHASERAMSHTALAALHDDDARLGRAAERIREALAEGGSFGAVILPPWLGVTAPRAAALSERVGAPCGEVLVSLDGPSGTRFEGARDRCFAAITTIESVHGRSVRVSDGPEGHGMRVELGAGGSIEADAVVLATGGLIGGGIAYTPGDAAPSRATPPPARAAFALTYEAPVTLGHHGRPLVVPGSIFGVQPESLVSSENGASILERIGVVTVDGFAVGGTPRTPNDGAHVFVAGDALADAPRTLLAAFASGTAAGRAAAQV